MSSSRWQTVLVRCRYDPALAPILLALLRVAACLYPQHGYVHADEFFQASDIVAGRHMGVKHVPAWEFTTPKPIRSMLLPFLINYGALTTVRSFTDSPSPYWLLVAPRLIYTLLSFVVDVCVYKLCKYYSRRGLWYLPLSVMLQSSFASLTLFTRTLSNTLEAIIFSLLLVMTCRSIRNDLSITQSNSHELRATADAGTAARTRPLSTTSSHNIASNDLVTTIAIGILSALGTFTRPTFPAFACVPLLYWIYDAWRYKCKGNFRKLVKTRIVIVASAALITAFLLSLFDTVYYRNFAVIEQAAHLLADGQLEKLYSHLTHVWVLAPLNFVAFNTNTDNLEQFGIHLPYTHWLVNLPILFSVLAYVFYTKLIALLFSRGRYNGLHRALYNMNRIHSMMFLTIIVATTLLSVVPHQEYRFLLPLLVPFVYVFAFKVYANSDLLMLWLLCNTLFVYFYGAVHQSGVTRALFDLHDIVHNSNKDNINHLVERKIDIIASRCYLVPTYLLNIPDNEHNVNLYLSKATDDFGHNMKLAANKILTDDRYHHDIYVLLPSTFREYFEQEMANQSYLINTLSVKTFSPHFTYEDIESSIKFLFEKGLARWREAFGFDLMHVELRPT